MGNNDTSRYAPFQHHGPAKLFVFDSVRQTWSGFGLIENPKFTGTVGTKSKYRRKEGRRVAVATRQSGDETAMLTFNWLESLDPYGNQIIYGDKTNSQTLNAAAVGYTDFEAMLFRNEQEGFYIDTYAPYDSSSCNYSRLPAPATFVATISAPGTGSAWPSAGNPDAYCWSQGLFLRPGTAVVPALTTVMDFNKLDVEWTLGAPFDNDTAVAGYDGVPLNFAAATDAVKFTGTGPAKGPNPDYVVIWYNTSNSLASATAAQIISYATFIGAGTVLLTLPAGDTYVAAQGASFFVDLGTHDVPNWSQLTIDTDIVWDNVRQAWKLKGGSYNGRQARGRFFHVWLSSFDQSIGPSGTSEDYRQFMVVCLEQAESGSTPLYAEGDRLIIYKGNAANLPWELSWPEDDWEPGMAISIPCVSDPSNNEQYATRRVISPALKSYTIQLNY